MSGPDHRVGPGVVLAFLSAMALNGLDATIITPALPRIASDLGAGLDHTTAVEWSFLVAAGLALPAAGWAGSRWRPAWVLACCSVVFALGCAVALAAPVLEVLVAARALQGIASGLMVPVGLVMAYDGATGSDRLRIARWTTVPLTLVPMVGPLLGGWLTQHHGWRSMFAVLLVLAMVVALTTWWVGRDGRATDPAARLDAIGLLLVGGAILLATIALPLSSSSLPLALGCLVAAVPVAFLARRWCRRPGRVLDLGVTRLRTFRAGLVTTALCAAVVNALLCAVPVLLVTRQGHSTTEAGLVLAAESLGVLLGARLVGSAQRFGVRGWVLASVLATVPCVVVALLGGGRWALPTAATGLALVGILLGQPTMLGQVMAFHGLAGEQMPSATVLLMGLRSVASAWGVVAVSLTLPHPGAALWCAALTVVLVLALLLPVGRVPAATWAATVGEGPGPA